MTDITIPDAAVEAAAKADYERWRHPNAPAWEDADEGVRQRWRDTESVPLAAAAPHIAAQLARGNPDRPTRVHRGGVMSAAGGLDQIDSGPGWFEVIHPSHATTHVVYVHEDGSLYFPEGAQVLDRHEFAFADARGMAHRLVRSAALVAALQAVLRVCDAAEATPVPGIVITGAAVSTTNIRRAIEGALS